MPSTSVKKVPDFLGISYSALLAFFRPGLVTIEVNSAAVLSEDHLTSSLSRGFTRNLKLGKSKLSTLVVTSAYCRCFKESEIVHSNSRDHLGSRGSKGETRFVSPMQNLTVLLTL